MQWKFKKTLYFFLAALLISVFSSLLITTSFAQRGEKTSFVASNPVISKFDFEKGNLKGWKFETCCGHSVQPSAAYSRSGRYSARFELRRTDPTIHGGKRSELRLKSVPANSEYWYGFSMRLPSDWMPDESFEIVAQWHNLPDTAQGETWRSPALAFTVKLNQWRIVNRWDPKRVTRNNDPRPEGGIAQLWSGKISPGLWTDWVVHAKWSHRSDGVLQVWKNGTLIVNKVGPNTYNDAHGPYLKTGLYKPDWKFNPKRSKTHSRVLFVDEFRIAGRTGSYASVAPQHF